MKIKDLFKMMEKANQFAKFVGEEERYELEICISEEQYFDWYFGKSFKNFKDFQKYCKEEYTENYRNYFKDVDITMGEDGQGEGHFIVNRWYIDKEEKHIVKVHFWKKREY